MKLNLKLPTSYVRLIKRPVRLMLGLRNQLSVLISVRGHHYEYGSQRLWFTAGVEPVLTSKSRIKRQSPTYKTTRDCPRVTLRLSVEDHARLKELADGMALATYIRAKVLEETLPRIKRRSVSSVVDKQALAQILGLLGQSRIANNLNQLAYHANIGALVMDEEIQEQITETYDHVIFLRQTLIKALGLKT